MKIETIKENEIIIWKETQDFKQLTYIQYRDTGLYQYGDDVVIDFGSLFSTPATKQKTLTQLLWWSQYNVNKKGAFSFCKPMITDPHYWADKNEPEFIRPRSGDISNPTFRKWTDSEIKL